MADRPIDGLWSDLADRLGRALEGLGLDPAVDFAIPPDPSMGDLGFPCFPYAKILRKAPPAIAAQIADAIEPGGVIAAARAVGPYMNVDLDLAQVAGAVLEQVAAEGPAWGGDTAAPAERWMIEYSSPNTNKPLHLGHIRNNLLGLAVGRILDYHGHQVRTVNLINDRGIHISKTLVAYQRWAHGRTPESEGVKGDHFVGTLYVKFETEFKAEYDAWLKKHAGEVEPTADEYFNDQSVLGAEARGVLRRWEAGDEEVINLWQRMNEWVYDGFRTTYDRMGCRFDHWQYESQTYKLGKEVVTDGRARGLFQTRGDGAVILDLAKVGLEGEKVLLRPDGTSVYMTQDIGTALERFDRFELDRLVYVVGDEQLYHFQVLFKVLDLLRDGLAERCQHLAYGMIRLPEGRMKSREGKVVDADDLMTALHELALEEVRKRLEAGKAHYHQDLSDDEAHHRAERIAQAALKYFMFRFTPRKSFEYNPEASIDFMGQTGPYCLYTYARTRSLLRKAGMEELQPDPKALARLSTPVEKKITWDLLFYPKAVADAARQLDPSKIADYVYNLCKDFNLIFADREGHPILTCEDPALKKARLHLAHATGTTIQSALALLGIETLEEM